MGLPGIISPLPESSIEITIVGVSRGGILCRYGSLWPFDRLLPNAFFPDWQINLKKKPSDRLPHDLGVCVAKLDTERNFCYPSFHQIETFKSKLANFDLKLASNRFLSSDFFFSQPAFVRHSPPYRRPISYSRSQSQRKEGGRNRGAVERVQRQSFAMIWVFPKIRVPKMDGL